jgi:hypothetical protein
MKQKLPLILLVSLGIVFNIYAQNYTISGYIRDAETGEALIGAYAIHNKTQSGTTSNNYGFYSITLPADSVEVVFSYIGYVSHTLKLDLKSSINIDVRLSTSILLNEVVITDRERYKIEEQSQMSSIDIPISQIKAIPALLGEADVLKALQLLPGVQSGGEGQSGLYVRGGSPDQNLILLDGVPVYNASHLFGFFSVFNTDAIKDVKLIKGGYPARYGGRLSSVIDIAMKEGNNQKVAGTASIGLIASRLTIEGPLGSENTSFIISARRTYIDILASPLIRQSFKSANSSGNAGYYFYDLNAKVNHKISNKDRVFLSVYGGRDKFYFNERYKSGSNFEDYSDIGLGWGNLTAAARWNRQWTPKLFSNTTLTYSQYNLNNKVEFGTLFPETKQKNIFALDYLAGIRDWGIKSEFDYLPNPDHHIRFGANWTYHQFNPGRFLLKEESTVNNVNRIDTVGQNQVFAHETYLYIEDDIRINEKIKVNVGLHASFFLVNQAIYPSLQPRISARYLLPNSSSLKVSFATMQQFIHLLAYEGIGLPTDLWVPSTERIRPQQSWQAALGYSRTIQKNIEFSAEIYYRKMSNVISYDDGQGIFDISDWQDRVIQGKGYSYGLELFLQKKYGKLNGWVGYTLSWTMRQFDELNQGRPFPFRYDRRHDISIVAIYDFNDRIDLSGTWIFGTGNAITLPNSQFPGTSDGFNFINTFQTFGERNDFRMGNYHRMDIGINFKKQKKYYHRTWSFGAYNVYSRNNPFFIYLGSEPADFDPVTGATSFKPALKQVSLFPIIPYATWTATF